MVPTNGTSTWATNNLNQILACSCSSKIAINKDKAKNKRDRLKASSAWPQMTYFMEEANVIGTT